MGRADCVELLQWALPRLGLRWAGYRKVRSQVCKRIGRRARELGLETADYRSHLEHHSDEWPRLEAMCRITISRFYRDRGVCDALAAEILPDLADRCERQGRGLGLWSAGCASGEEPYSLSILWRLGLEARYPGLDLEILATDSSEMMLERAKEALYLPSSLKDLPEAWRDEAFASEDGLFRLRTRFQTPVRFERADLREAMPDRRFDLVLCRNLAFTYFVEEIQREVLGRLLKRVRPGGALVIGNHERLPAVEGGPRPWRDSKSIYRVA